MLDDEAVNILMDKGLGESKPLNLSRMSNAELLNTISKMGIAIDLVWQDAQTLLKRQKQMVTELRTRLEADTVRIVPAGIVGEVIAADRMVHRVKEDRRGVFQRTPEQRAAASERARLRWARLKELRKARDGA